MITITIGQLVHDEIAKRDGWARKWDEMSPLQQKAWNDGVTAALAVAPGERTPSDNVIGDQHPDDLAVDRFAAAMKAKLAQKRAEGRGGWDNPDECSIEWLSELLRSHVEKADPVDVGNFAMMIHQRGGRICK